MKLNWNVKLNMPILILNPGENIIGKITGSVPHELLGVPVTVWRVQQSNRTIGLVANDPALSLQLSEFTGVHVNVEVSSQMTDDCTVVKRYNIKETGIL